MNPIQKPLDKIEREFTRQTSKKLDNQKITQTERKNQKLEEKTLPQDQKKNIHIDNHCDVKISHAKITKHSFHNLKYFKKLSFRSHFEIN